MAVVGKLPSTAGTGIDGTRNKSQQLVVDNRQILGLEVRFLFPEALVKQIGAGDRYVYVYKNGKVSYNKVELGKHIGQKYEILSGVNPGDEVVIAGQIRLTNGKEVEVSAMPRPANSTLYMVYCK